MSQVGVCSYDIIDFPNVPHFINGQGLPIGVVPVIEVHVKWNDRNARARGLGCRGRMTVCW